MSRRKPKPKTVSYELIPRDGDVGRAMYDMLDDLIEQHHGELSAARIALAWCTSWRPDVDGRVTLGKCKKASDLDRELAAYDFIVLLRRAFWLDDRVTFGQKRALLDHELCHARRKYDANGEPVEDERGRPVFRCARHDIEEFQAVVERHGCYKADLETFAAALVRTGSAPYQPCEECTEMPGWVWVEQDGTRRVARCQCFRTWQERRELAVGY